MTEQRTHYDAGHEAGGERQSPLKGLYEEGFRALIAQMQAGYSEGFLRYLTFASHFRTYTPANQMLIFMQCPGATRVAGHKTWEELGYHVKRGQKAIKILAPRMYERPKKRVRVRADGAAQEVEEADLALYFVPVNVFDVSQLADYEERPMPEGLFPSVIAGEAGNLNTKLEAAIAADGILLEERDLGEAYRGLSFGGKIMLHNGLDSVSRFLTLTHEYAHELLHKGPNGANLSKKLKECQAEAVAFVVAHHFAVPAPYSSDYLQHWGNTPQDLLAQLDVVRTTTSTIIDVLDGKGAETRDHRRRTAGAASPSEASPKGKKTYRKRRRNT